MTEHNADERRTEPTDETNLDAPSPGSNPGGNASETPMREAQSTGSDGFARPEDFQVGRDGEGKRLAQVHELPTFGKVKLLPMNYGDIKEHFGDGTTHMAEAELIAEIMNDYMVEPDMHVDADYVAEMYPTAPAEILRGVFAVSKVDANVVAGPDGSATVQVNQQGN